MNLKMQTIDDIEKLSNQNELIENALGILNNLATDVSLHHDLVQHGIFEVLGMLVQ